MDEDKKLWPFIKAWDIGGSYYNNPRSNDYDIETDADWGESLLDSRTTTQYPILIFKRPDNFSLATKIRAEGATVGSAHYELTKLKFYKKV